MFLVNFRMPDSLDPLYTPCTLLQTVALLILLGIKLYNKRRGRTTSERLCQGCEFSELLQAFENNHQRQRYDDADEEETSYKEESRAQVTFATYHQSDHERANSDNGYKEASAEAQSKTFSQAKYPLRVPNDGYDTVC